MTFSLQLHKNKNPKNKKNQKKIFKRSDIYTTFCALWGGMGVSCTLFKSKLFTLNNVILYNVVFVNIFYHVCPLKYLVYKCVVTP